MTNRRVAQLAEHLPAEGGEDLAVSSDQDAGRQTRLRRPSRYTQGVGGSSPSPPTISFGATEPIGLPECPYLTRWVLGTPWFAIRLHRWEASDDVRYFHDHPWWYSSFVLRGAYLDVSPSGLDLVRRGSLRCRAATHRHSVVTLVRGTLTLLMTGPAKRRWGFWVDGKLIKRDRYFAVYGHHPCVDGIAPVRIRPDGSRI